MKLFLLKKEEIYDLTKIYKSIKWSGRKGTPARTLDVILLDDDLHDRANFEILEGDYLILKNSKDKELFRGLVTDLGQGDNKQISVKCYDEGIRLSNNRDTFSYKNKTACDIFRDTLLRFKIPIGTVDSCSYKIPELIKKKATGFDVVADALSQDFKATGVRHAIISKNGKLSLITRKKNLVMWVLDAEENILKYSSKQSISKIKTRIKAVSKEDKVVTEKINSELESKIGVFKEVETMKEALTTAQINDLINGMLKDKSRVEKSLTLTTVGIDDVISGVAIFVIIPHLNIKRSFYVDDDTHTYQNGKHTMQLKLNATDDF